MTDELTDDELSRMKPAKDVLKPELFERLTTPSDIEERAREIVNPLLDHIDEEPMVLEVEELISAIASALEEEREACAKIADDHELASRENGFSDAADVAQQLASAIRRETDNG